MKIKRNEFEKRKNELQEKIKNAKDEELEEIRKQIEELKNAEVVDEENIDERNLLKNAIDRLDERKVSISNVREIANPKEEERKMKEKDEVMERAAKSLKSGKLVTFSIGSKEKRSVSVSEGNVLLSDRTKTQISDSFDRPSDMVEKLNVVPLEGGESYKVAFEKGGSDAGYTVEGGEYKDIDPEFDHTETGRAKITAYAEVTEEIEKLPDAEYVDRVERAVTKAIKKKIGAQAIAGEGTANTIRGIYNSENKVLDGKGDIEVQEIDADTLNDIVFGFGGEEAVEDEQTLILNKDDLKAFSKIKNDHGEFIYKITKKKGEGRISYANGGADVPYVINSACSALSSEATENGKYTMVYGSLTDYELPVFADVEVMMSTDYKFKEGMKAFKASCIVGGTVSKFNGFLRVKKVAPTV